MNKNSHGRILKEKPKEQHISTVPMSCHILKRDCEYVESYKLVKRLIWRSYFNKILQSIFIKKLSLDSLKSIFKELTKILKRNQ